MRCGVWCCLFIAGMVLASPGYKVSEQHNAYAACIKRGTSSMVILFLLAQLLPFEKTKARPIWWYIQENDWTITRWDIGKNILLCSVSPCGHAMHAVSFCMPDSTCWFCVCETIYRIDCGRTLCDMPICRSHTLYVLQSVSESYTCLILLICW